MRVSLSEIQRYADTLAELSAEANVVARGQIALWMSMHPEATVAECRELAAYVVSRTVERYGDAAATNAAKLYDEVMDAEGVDVGAAEHYDGPDGAAIDGAVRRLVGRLDGESPDREGFLDQVGALVSEKVRKAASDTVVRNVERDAGTRKGRGVRFARIPQRPDPCPWCVMLASRGFDYKSAESAAAGSHHRCTCLVMPGVNGKTVVEGYDQKGMYDRYKSCRETIEHDLRPGWERLSKAEQDAYENGYNEYCEKRIVAEMGTRDRHWLKTGEPTETEYSEKSEERYGILIDSSLPLSERYALRNITGKDNEKKDVFVHHMLSRNGFSVRTRLIVNQGGDENIDIDLNGCLCEVKSPEGNPNASAKDELKFIYRDVQRARHQFEDRVGKEGKAPVPLRLVMSNYYTGFGADREDELFQRFCHEVDRQGFTEALFIKKDGTIIRAK